MTTPTRPHLSIEQQLQAVELWRTQVADAQNDADQAYTRWDIARKEGVLPDGVLVALHSDYMQKRQRVLALGAVPRRHPGEPGRKERHA